MKTYIVQITETVTRQFEVEAVSPEAAQSVAEERRNDGEAGNVMDVEVLDVICEEVPNEGEYN